MCTISYFCGLLLVLVLSCNAPGSKREYAISILCMYVRLHVGRIDNKADFDFF